MPDLSLLGGNPYLTMGELTPDQKRERLFGTIANTLIGLGAGISGAGAQGRSWLSGLAPGAAMGMNMDSQQQQRDEAERMHRMTWGLHAAEYQDKRDERARQMEANKAYAAGLRVPTGDVPTASPGFDVKPPPYQMGPNLSREATTIAGIESRGQANPYSTLGPVTMVNGKPSRAHGKYGVMDFNIPAWTKEATGQEMTPEQFLSSPQVQDAVFNQQFGKSLKQYGNPQDAASVWFSGKPLAGNTSGPDELGTTVGGYVNKFNKGYYGTSGAPSAVAGGNNPAAMPDSVPPDLPSAPGGPPSFPALGLPPALMQPSPAPMSMAPAAPVMQGGSESPTPQRIQFTPPPANAPPPEPPQVPMPRLSAADANRLADAVQSGQLTRKEAEAERNRIIGEQWTRDQTRATQGWQAKVDEYKFQRGEQAKDAWQIVPPQDAQALGLPANVQFQKNSRAGEYKPVRDTKETTKDITPIYSAPKVQKIVEKLSPADRAAFNAATVTGDHKSASAILTKAQTGLSEEQQQLTGKALLDTLPYGDRTIVEGFLDGSVMPADLSKKASNGMDINRYITLAKQADKDWSPGEGGARRAFETKFMTTGQGGQTMLAANTAFAHMRAFRDLVDAQHNTNAPAPNTVVNAVKKQFGDANVPTTESARILLGTEIAKAVRGAGSLNESEEKAAQTMVNPNASPAQSQAALKMLTDFMMGRVHSIEDMAKARGMPEKTVQGYLSPSSREAIDYIDKNPVGGNKGSAGPRPPLSSFGPGGGAAGPRPPISQFGAAP